MQKFGPPGYEPHNLWGLYLYDIKSVYQNDDSCHLSAFPILVIKKISLLKKKIIPSTACLYNLNLHIPMIFYTTNISAFLLIFFEKNILKIY